MTLLSKTRFFAAATMLASAAMLPASASAVDLEFYFPVAVGGDAAGIIEGMTSAYMEENPGVNINAIYNRQLCRYDDAGDHGGARWQIRPSSPFCFPSTCSR